MNPEFQRKLPNNLSKDLKKMNDKRLIKMMRIRAYKTAIRYLEEDPPNVQKILKSLDVVQNTNNRWEKSKNQFEEKMTFPKKEFSKKNLKKKKKSGKIIKDYFAVKQIKKIEKNTEKWYKPWQPPDNAKFRKLCEKNSNFKIELNSKLKPNLSIFRKNENKTANDYKRKIKILSFFENYRPPYYGTFRKKAKTLNGRKVFDKDRTLFNYDIDSEQEWGEEPEDAEEIGSEDDLCNQEEDELCEKRQLRKDGLLQDDFLIPEDENSGSKETTVKRVKIKNVEEYVPNVEFVKFAENGRFLNKIVKYGKLSNIKIVKNFKSDESFLYEKVNENLCDQDLCGLKENDQNFIIAKLNFERRQKSIKVIPVNEGTAKLGELKKKVEDLEIKMKGKQPKQFINLM